MKLEDKNKESTAIVEVGEARPITPSEQILAPLELSDYAQFLYSTNFGGQKGQDFTYEGVKTLGLNNGISTSDVRWDSETWLQVTEDLKAMSDWVKSIPKGPF